MPQIATDFMKDAFIDYSQNVKFDGASHRIELLNDMFYAWLKDELKELTDYDSAPDEKQISNITNDAWYHLKTIELIVKLEEDINWLNKHHPEVLKEK